MADKNVKMAEANIGLAYHLVHARRPNEWDKDDEIQEAFLALCHASSKFDPALGKFSTYAARWIRAYLTQHQQLMKYPVKVPSTSTGTAAQKERALQLRRVTHRSMEEPITEDGIEFGEKLEAPIHDPDAGISVAMLLENLDDRSAEIVRLHYLEDLNLVEIGRRFGISKSRAHVLLTRAMAQLREIAEADSIR